MTNQHPSQAAIEESKDPIVQPIVHLVIEEEKQENRQQNCYENDKSQNQGQVMNEIVNVSQELVAPNDSSIKNSKINLCCPHPEPKLKLKKFN